MALKMRHTPKQIAQTLSRVEKLVAEGASVSEAAKAVRVKYGTLYNWRRRYSELSGNGVAQVRLLQAENARLRRALLELDAAALSG